MDALALLTADHNRVRGLFTRFKNAKEAEDAAQMTQVGQQIFTELSVHTAIEEERFYPWAAALSDEVKQMIDEGIQEHQVVKTLIEDLAQLTPDQPEWLAKITVMIENVEHHAQEEESELFPKVRAASSSDDLEQLGTQLDQDKGAKGAPTLADTIDLTTQELKELASEQEIPGRSSMDHDELAATVSPTGGTPAQG